MQRIKYTLKQPRKFNSKLTQIDGITFHSKKEAAYYCVLKEKQKNGEVHFFLMQVPFILPGKTKCRLDFMVFNSDGTIRFVEIKGMKIRLGEIKRAQVEELYNIEIEVI